MLYQRSPALWEGKLVAFWKILSHVPSRSVKDLELVSRVIFGAPSTDNSVPPLPFKEVSLPKKMKFGYYTWGRDMNQLE